MYFTNYLLLVVKTLFTINNIYCHIDHSSYRLPTTFQQYPDMKFKKKLSVVIGVFPHAQKDECSKRTRTSLLRTSRTFDPVRNFLQNFFLRVYMLAEYLKIKNL